MDRVAVGDRDDLASEFLSEARGGEDENEEKGSDPSHRLFLVNRQTHWISWVKLTVPAPLRYAIHRDGHPYKASLGVYRILWCGKRLWSIGPEWILHTRLYSFLYVYDCTKCVHAVYL